nr:MAG TPA: hypothetical protein [Inoviridae sp.]
MSFFALYATLKIRLMEFIGDGVSPMILFWF